MGRTILGEGASILGTSRVGSFEERTSASPRAKENSKTQVTKVGREPPAAPGAGQVVACGRGVSSQAVPQHQTFRTTSRAAFSCVNPWVIPLTSTLHDPNKGWEGCEIPTWHGSTLQHGGKRSPSPGQWACGALSPLGRDRGKQHPGEKHTPNHCVLGAQGKAGQSPPTDLRWAGSSLAAEQQSTKTCRFLAGGSRAPTGSARRGVGAQHLLGWGPGGRPPDYKCTV